MTTALLTHADCIDHVTPDGHPERVVRLEHVLHALKRVTAPLAAEDDVLRLHPASYLAMLRLRRTLPQEGYAQFDADTWMSPGSLTAAFRAVGSAIRAVDLVLSGEVQNAFSATRHHAETDTPMGFCLFGNAALAAKHALSRVAVVDFDVHHGNGTQDLLWDEPRALVITSQQMPLWPGTGRPGETSAHDTILNIPLPPESDGNLMKSVYTTQAFPRLRAFKPELIVISAGFDAHQDDPLAQFNWSTGDFQWITAEHCEGRIVSILEGDYDLAALSAATRTHVEELIKASS